VPASNDVRSMGLGNKDYNYLIGFESISNILSSLVTYFIAFEMK
jgi:hypothetical protein